MLPDALAQPVTKCLIASRLGSVAFLVLLILSATATYAHGTTVEHDLHIVHNVDNRSEFLDSLFQYTVMTLVTHFYLKILL